MKITNKIPPVKAVELRTLRPGNCFYLPQETPERAYLVGVFYITRLCDGDQTKLDSKTKVIPVEVEVIVSPKL